MMMYVPGGWWILKLNCNAVLLVIFLVSTMLPSMSCTVIAIFSLKAGRQILNVPIEGSGNTLIHSDGAFTTGTETPGGGALTFLMRLFSASAIYKQPELSDAIPQG